MILPRSANDVKSAWKRWKEVSLSESSERNPKSWENRHVVEVEDLLHTVELWTLKDKDRLAKEVIIKHLKKVGKVISSFQSYSTYSKVTGTYHHWPQHNNKLDVQCDASARLSNLVSEMKFAMLHVSIWIHVKKDMHKKKKKQSKSICT